MLLKLNRLASMASTLAVAGLLGALGAGCTLQPPRPSVTPPVEYLLLGEIHDNAEQHRLRAARVAALLKDGRRTTVVFEQLQARQSAELLALQQGPADAEQVADTGRLDRKGWKWPLHKPIIEASLQGRATVLGGNLSREELRPLMKEVGDAWPAVLRQRLEATPWSDADRESMRRSIDEGHCGKLPKAMEAPMALAQRARDAAMAEAMIAAAKSGAERIILIAGNGHVDRGLGVPRYLLAAGVPATSIRAVGYLEHGQSDGGQFDEQVLTAPAEREDPCKGFRS